MLKIRDEYLEKVFPAYKNTEPGEWAHCSSEYTDVLIKKTDMGLIEAGLYREPECNEEYSGTFTFECFYRDTVVICEEENNGEGQDLADLLIANLPSEPGAIWQDGAEILTVSEDFCESLADIIELFIDCDVCTSYYDPKEDERNDEIDSHTGYYSIHFN